ncbi:hypothetical protein ADUPG1_008921 [Aduncisulcus paluster]|uniref:Uncharacterized protein n=1 Tax=Aduncisulcus paluster TaxID=2918883 RepID=A0ABQ5KWM5_9EUKA|nr:hypothetical protein ADUPG1_008921 [Aduncisulcus paluster]
MLFCPSLSVLSLLLFFCFCFFPRSTCVFVAGNDGNGGGQAGVLITFTVNGIYDIFFNGLEPWFDSFMGTFDIPDFSTTVDFGVGKASVSLLNFQVVSYNFFPGDKVIVSTIPSENAVFVEMSGAGVALSLDYDVKLLTYPYTDMNGSASLSIGDAGIITTISVTSELDSSDLSCNNGFQGCGYLPLITTPELEVHMNNIALKFIGDASPVLQMIADLVSSAIVPFLSSAISDEIMKFINNNHMDPDMGLYSPKYLSMDNRSKYYFGYAQSFIFGDSFIVLPMIGISTFGNTPGEDDAAVYPDFNPSNLPYAAFSSSIQFTIAFDAIKAVFYNTIYNSNEYFSDWKGTFDTIACVSTEDGCVDSDRNWNGDQSSAYVIQHNLGRDIDQPPSNFSPLYTTRYWSDLLPDLYSLCSNCYIDFTYTFNTVDYVPTVPDISMRVDGLDIVYHDFYIIVDIVQVDDGSSVASVGISVDIIADAIVWSDHAYINFLQSVMDFENLSIESCAIPTLEYGNTDKECIMGSAEWLPFVKLMSTLFLDDMFQNTFKQSWRGWSWFNRMPLAYWYVCTTKEEEVYYAPKGSSLHRSLFGSEYDEDVINTHDEYIIVSAEFDEYICCGWDFDGSSRNPDGTCYCVSQVS